MWQIDYDYIVSWLDALDALDAQSVAHIFAALELLEREGPTLGRPLVDTIKGSVFGNMKELRPASPGSAEIRILFAFDPGRRAVLLLGGNKAKGKTEKLSGRIGINKQYPKRMLCIVATL